MLNTIEILNFKNIKEINCDFSPKINGFFGKNGMGKTNILDAIHYLSLIKSHIGTTDYLSIKKGESETYINGVYTLVDTQIERISLRIRKEKSKILSHNGKAYNRLSEHIGRFPIVIISPQDYLLIKGGSCDRRRFLNRLLSQIYPAYMRALVNYEKALQQRKNLLTNHVWDDTLLSAIEWQLAENGAIIHKLRESFFKTFIPYFNDAYHLISGYDESVSILYKSDASNDINEYSKKLFLARKIDFQIESNSYGIHKDEIQLLLEDELVRKIGSEGQNKCFLIGLKFAEYRVLSEYNQMHPILLLDDLFDKLDESRVKKIIDYVSKDTFGQIFITDTNRKYLDNIIDAQNKPYKLFEVSNGNIQSL